eukprot:PhF_6_TR19819/c0_g1_i1/m.28901/K14347/SLC10A7, P7; solute carrier family 10 (sodium/bile acid cotransporter), member 7
MIQLVSLGLVPIVFTAAKPFAEACGVPAPCALGIAFAGCLPTTIGVSIALTRLAGGDVALAVLHSAVGNLLGVVVTPLLCVFLTGVRPPDLDAFTLANKMMYLLGLPVLCGLMLNNALPPVKLITIMARYSSIAQQVFLLMLLSNVFSDAFVTSANTTASTSSFVALFFVMFVLHKICFFSGYYGLFRSFPQSQRVAAAYLGAQKTASMGVPLLGMMYEGDPNLALITLPLVMYHPIQTISGAAIAPYLARMAKRIY